MPLANLEPHEGSVAGTATINLDRRALRIVITNDSSTNNLQYKFSQSASYATLKPTETVSLWLSVRTVYLSGTANYRVWGMG